MLYGYNGHETELKMLSRQIKIQHQYLNLPIHREGSVLGENDMPAGRIMDFIIGGKIVLEFRTRLADKQPDFWVFSDVSKYQGQTLTIQTEDQDISPDVLELITQSDTPAGFEDLYRERFRPQFHFTSRRGWINDPDGPVYYKGVYHLFYQHNPYGWTHENNMHWGHATSTDLVHWEEQPTALSPDELGTIYSGSAVVDWNNTAGFGNGKDPAIVCMYTSAGKRGFPISQDKPFTQSIAYSNDGCKTFQTYENNPVIPHMIDYNRDPKVFWYAPQSKWVMLLFTTGIKIGEQSYWEYALFDSPDLKTWKMTSKVLSEIPAGAWPDMFEMPVEGDPQSRKWVIWTSGGTYIVGDFDGRTFTPETKPLEFYRSGSADQVWNDMPDGRIIQISWLRSGHPGDGKPGHAGMPFNQQLTFPRELRLRITEQGPRIFCTPIDAIEKLRAKAHEWKDLELGTDNNPLADLEGELFEIRVEMNITDATEVGLNIRGHAVTYDVHEQKLSCGEQSGPLALQGGRLSLVVLVDRSSIEAFANEGEVAVSAGILPEEDNLSLEIYSKNGVTHIDTLSVYELRSIWSS